MEIGLRYPVISEAVQVSFDFLLQFTKLLHSAESMTPALA